MVIQTVYGHCYTVSPPDCVGWIDSVFEAGFDLYNAYGHLILLSLVTFEKLICSNSVEVSLGIHEK